MIISILSKLHIFYFKEILKKNDIFTRYYNYIEMSGWGSNNQGGWNQQQGGFNPNQGPNQGNLNNIKVLEIRVLFQILILEIKDIILTKVIKDSIKIKVLIQIKVLIKIKVLIQIKVIIQIKAI